MVSRLTVVVPVYNERRSIAAALDSLRSVEFPVEVEVIVVDDGSDDGTRDVLSAWEASGAVQVVRHDRNRGKGAALRTALGRATGDVFVAYDADGEYEAADLLRILRPILENRADVVFGTRAFGSHTSYNFWYVVGNKVLTLWTNVLFNCYISDLETCFKMMRTDVLRALHPVSEGFDIEAEVTAKLLRAGYRPFEVPIAYRARTRAQGKKIDWRDGIVAAWTVLKVRLGAMRA